MPPVYSAPILPVEFQKAMVFIDGSNLFERLRQAKLVLDIDLAVICASHLGGRQLLRTYLYTTTPRLDDAKGRHGDRVINACRVVLGESILRDGREPKEKGVDAQLVADLVYHAASKNCDYAMVVSADTDFVHVVRRVEDFGARTAVLSMCVPIHERLRAACDDALELTTEQLVSNRWAHAI